MAARQSGMPDAAAGDGEHILSTNFISLFALKWYQIQNKFSETPLKFIRYLQIAWMLKKYVQHSTMANKLHTSQALSYPCISFKYLSIIIIIYRLHALHYDAWH